jgi:predicted nucleic acid-binding protein
MARPTLVLDASVGVKWFSAAGESYVPQARAIMQAHADGEVDLIVPDIFFHDICNALVYKKIIPLSLVEESLSTLFDLSLTVLNVNQKFLYAAARLARQAGITEYDACYAVAAVENHCPLVTANPRHQNSKSGCRTIFIEQWA